MKIGGVEMRRSSQQPVALSFLLRIACACIYVAVFLVWFGGICLWSPCANAQISSPTGYGDVQCKKCGGFTSFSPGYFPDRCSHCGASFTATSSDDEEERNRRDELKRKADDAQRLADELQRQKQKAEDERQAEMTRQRAREEALRQAEIARLRAAEEAQRKAEEEQKRVAEEARRRAYLDDLVSKQRKVMELDNHNSIESMKEAMNDDWMLPKQKMVVVDPNVVDLRGITNFTVALLRGDPEACRNVRDAIGARCHVDNQELWALQRAFITKAPPPPPGELDSVKPGDVILVAPEGAPSYVLGIFDWLQECSPSAKSVSHIIMCVKDVNGHKLFMDTTASLKDDQVLGTSVIDERELRRRYGGRGTQPVALAQPLSDRECKELWEFSKEQQKISSDFKMEQLQLREKTMDALEGASPTDSSMESTVNRIAVMGTQGLFYYGWNGSNYGVFGDGESVCSEMVQSALLKIDRYTESKGILGKLGVVLQQEPLVKITPSDFLHQDASFWVRPMAVLK